MSTARTQTKARDVEIIRTGEQIILPPGMSYKDAREWLTRKEEEENTTVSITEVIDGFPMDAAYAFSLALYKKFGWVDHVPSGFWGMTPPQMIAVEVGLNTDGSVITKQIPWGRMSIPKWDGGTLSTSIEPKPGSALPQFVIVGNMQKKWSPEVADVARLTREILKEKSIYRGKAIRVRLPGPGEKFDARIAPKFITTNVDPNNLIFPAQIEAAIQDNLWSIIQGTEAAREDNVPLKRGIVLGGKYGVGKTLAAAVTARYCVENGWTYILLENISQLAAAMAFARQYAPAVLFAEDIDSVTKGERTEDLNNILNTIDGVESKGSELMVVLSTNHLELISKAMLRPGRIDAVINITPPDAAAAIRLVEVYSRTKLDRTVEGFEEGMKRVGEKLNGLIPAVIREIVERSKTASISRWLKNGKVGARSITPTDLERSTDSMQMHLALMKDAPPPVHPLAIFGSAAGAAIGAGLVVSAREQMANARKTENELYNINEESLEKAAAAFAPSGAKG